MLTKTARCANSRGVPRSMAPTVDAETRPTAAAPLLDLHRVHFSFWDIQVIGASRA